MKTAISMPDDLFAEAEALAAELGTSRSHLYASAVREFLARHRPDAVTAALDEVYADEDAHADPAVAAAAVRALAAVEW
jgi:metal-responsive CopG/Arc/MetJ family transcriptional regulator